MKNPKIPDYPNTISDGSSTLTSQSFFDGHVKRFISHEFIDELINDEYFIDQLLHKLGTLTDEDVKKGQE